METKGKTCVPAPIECAAIDDAVGFESHAVAKLNFIADDAVWSNEAVVSDPGARADNCCGMNGSRVSGSGHNNIQDYQIRIW